MSGCSSFYACIAHENYGAHVPDFTKSSAVLVTGACFGGLLRGIRSIILHSNMIGGKDTQQSERERERETAERDGYIYIYIQLARIYRAIER